MRLRNFRRVLAIRADERAAHEGELLPIKLATATTEERQAAELARCDKIIEEHAKKMKSSGAKSVEYRCSRCRWSKSGVGCDTKYCNPHKWKLKMEKLIAELKAAQEAEDYAAQQKDLDGEEQAQLVKALKLSLLLAEQKLHKAFAQGTQGGERKLKEVYMTTAGGGQRVPS